MKTVIFVLVGMMCYAISNVILEQKLSKYNNLTLMVCMCTVIALSALVARSMLKPLNDPSWNFPKKEGLVIMIVMALIFGVGDYFYVGAYTGGGDLFTIVCISVMFPVFASLIKFAWTWKLPNVWQVGSYLLATAAVLLIAKANTVK